MTTRLLGLYHRLPAPVRSMAATLRGYQLRSWRYGPETETLVEEAFERERWSADRWTSWQEERLAHVLHRAATQVPYYRQQWADRRRSGDSASWECLENWPILEKEPLRANPRAFLVDGLDARRLFHLNTSGTSGKSLDLWFDRAGVRDLWALSEARWRRWYGVSRADRWAIVGGQLVTPVAQRRPPFWVWNTALKQLYMSSYHLAPDLIPYYLDALRRYRVKYIRGYSSSLNSLAQEALRLGYRDLRFRAAITNAEPLFDYQRAAIEEAFQCPVRETYGMGETVAAASECEHGRLHLWPEAGWIEVIVDGRPAPPGTAGDLVCTGLMSDAMPLVRYRVGDSGALAPDRSQCPCGRTLPELASIEGRVDDVLYTPDGRRVGRLDPVFKASLPVKEAQIIQEATDRVRVRYVPAAGFGPEAGRQIVEQVRARMGAIEVLLDNVPEVPRGANGKFRAVICQLRPEDRPH